MGNITRRESKNRDDQIIRYIRDFIGDNGYSPTLREIANHFGVVPLTIHKRVKRLTAQGRLGRDGVKITLPDALDRNTAARDKLTWQLEKLTSAMENWGSPYAAATYVQTSRGIEMPHTADECYLCRAEADLCDKCAEDDDET